MRTDPLLIRFDHLTAAVPGVPLAAAVPWIMTHDATQPAAFRTRSPCSYAMCGHQFDSARLVRARRRNVSALATQRIEFAARHGLMHRKHEFDAVPTSRSPGNLRACLSFLGKGPSQGGSVRDFSFA